MEIYSQFLNYNVIELIVSETNRYASQYLTTTEVKHRSMMRSWIDCTSVEIKKLLGIIMFMGICPLPQTRLYWSGNDLFKNDVIKQVMPRDRFEMLLKCLNFSNNEAIVTEEHRLAKIKPLVELMNNLFKKVSLCCLVRV